MKGLSVKKFSKLGQLYNEGLEQERSFSKLTKFTLHGMINLAQVGRTVAVLLARSRKVRTPQGAAPGKPRGEVTCGIGPQKQTAPVRFGERSGKGEMVV